MRRAGTLENPRGIPRPGAPQARVPRYRALGGPQGDHARSGTCARPPAERRVEAARNDQTRAD